MQKPKNDAFKEDMQGSGVKDKDAEDSEVQAHYPLRQHLKGAAKRRT